MNIDHLLVYDFYTNNHIAYWSEEFSDDKKIGFEKEFDSFVKCFCEIIFFIKENMYKPSECYRYANDVILKYQFNEIEKYFLLDQITIYVKNDLDYEIIGLHFFNCIKLELEANSSNFKFNVYSIKNTYDNPQNLIDKSDYIIGISNDYNKIKDTFDKMELCYYEYTDFDFWLRVNLKNQVMNENVSKENSIYNLNKDKKGVKINLIRIFHALHALRYFTTDDGTIPPKQKLMEDLGQFFNADFSEYSVDLSQAMSKLEPNLKIFNEMKEFIEKDYNEKCNK